MAGETLTDRMATLTSSGTVNLPDRVRDLSAKGIDMIDLSEGQPYYDTPAPIKESAKIALDSGTVSYVERAGLPELLSEIKAKRQRDNGIDVPVSKVILTVGAKHAILTAILWTFDPGSEVLVSDPYWTIHASCVEIADNTVRR